eukprot:SAG22_NODE_161_length_16908_cov_39.687965_16_plen_82_part_00
MSVDKQPGSVFALALLAHGAIGQLHEASPQPFGGGHLLRRHHLPPVCVRVLDGTVCVPQHEPAGTIYQILQNDPQLLLVFE